MAGAEEIKPGPLARLGRWHWVLFGVFLAVVALRTTAFAQARPLWHDEIFTVLVSQLPWRTLARALADGTDLQPPLNTLLTRIVHLVFAPGPIATRLVPLVAFLGCLTIVYRTVQRRAGATTALAAAMYLCWTAGYRYSAEARGYSLMLLCTAGALWCWLEAAAGRRRRMNLSLLWLSLAAGLWTHYYFVLVLAPIAAGEAVRSLRRQQIDWAVATVMAAAGLAWLPILAIAGSAIEQASTFWARASLSGIGPTYEFLLNQSIDAPVLMAAAVGVLAGWLIPRGQPQPGLPLHESIALLMLLLLPVMGILLGTFVTGVFSDHYALPAVVGMACGPPMLLWVLGRRRWVVLLPVVLLLGYRMADGPLVWPAHVKAGEPLAERSLLTQAMADRTAGPIAVSGGLVFLQFWYYATPDLRPQLVFPGSSAAALRHGPSDTVDRNLLALGHWTDVPVWDFDTFVTSHRKFRVYAYGGGWLVDELRRLGADLQPIGRETGAVLYSVEMRPGAAAPASIPR